MTSSKNIHLLKQHIKFLPSNPGVYQFLNDKGEIIYVGKAKNLKKRVGTYINKKNYNTAKLKLLAKQIADIRHIVVESEADALLLENTLIKKNKPKYNVLLKDDKTYPYICVSNEPFPRVYQTRKRDERDASYFGPYASVAVVKTALELIASLYPLRTCKYKLTKSNIEKGKFRVCLEYHIGKCKGPCEGRQTEHEYNENIRSIKNILRGNFHEVKIFLKEKMQKYSSEYKFEEAQEVKEKLQILEKYRSKSIVVNPLLKDLDVFSYLEDKKYAYVNYLKVINGAIVQSKTTQIKKVLDETDKEILALMIADTLKSHSSNRGELILPFHPGINLKNKKITVPKIGDRKKLLLLSERNARHYKLEKGKRQSAEIFTNKRREQLETMSKELNIKEPPLHIECFDISSTMGKNPVAACVVFRNGVPSRKEYRHYSIKTVNSADDYASMKEVVIRRYKKLLKDGNTLPQLVVIDGGKGQLGSAVEALRENNLDEKISVIAIAKKLEEIYVPGDSLPLYLNKQSLTLRIIQHIRNEAHRFSLRLHRKKRSADQTESQLLNVKGIGGKTIEKLYKDFKSFEKIKNASHDQISISIGKRKADLISSFLSDKKEI